MVTSAEGYAGLSGTRVGIWSIAESETLQEKTRHKAFMNKLLGSKNEMNSSKTLAI